MPVFSGNGVTNSVVFIMSVTCFTLSRQLVSLVESKAIKCSIFRKLLMLSHFLPSAETVRSETVFARYLRIAVKCKFIGSDRAGVM